MKNIQGWGYWSDANTREWTGGVGEWGGSPSTHRMDPPPWCAELLLPNGAPAGAEGEPRSHHGQSLTVRNTATLFWMTGRPVGESAGDKSAD